MGSSSILQAKIFRCQDAAFHTADARTPFARFELLHRWSTGKLRHRQSSVTPEPVSICPSLSRVHSQHQLGFEVLAGKLLARADDPLHQLRVSRVLPWGNRGERDRAQRIAAGRPEAIVLPDLSISQKASVLATAAGTVGLDTGLSHIAA